MICFDRKIAKGTQHSLADRIDETFKRAINWIKNYVRIQKYSNYDVFIENREFFIYFFQNSKSNQESIWFFKKKFEIFEKKKNLIVHILS